MAEWVRALNWRPGGPGLLGSHPAVATSLRSFGNAAYPVLPVYFGGDTKSRRSLLINMVSDYGVSDYRYGRAGPGEVKLLKYPQTNRNVMCVICRGLHHS